jgi:putative transposase
MFNYKLVEYIHNNPVEEEIVAEAVDYKYSSAIDYAGSVGVLDIEQL